MCLMEHDMSLMEHGACFERNTGRVLNGTRGVCYTEHEACVEWNTNMWLCLFDQKTY